MSIDLKRIEKALNSTHQRWDIYFYPEKTTIKGFLEQEKISIPDSGYSFYLNGVLNEIDTEICTPCLLVYYQAKSTLNLPIFEPKKHILYDQAGIVIAFKPAKLHTLPAKEQYHTNLRSLLSDLFKTEVHMPSRLDFSTAGLVLISKKLASHRFAQELFEKRWIEKTYLCEVSDIPEWKAVTVDKALASDPRHPVLRKTVGYGGQTARTYFTNLAQSSSTGSCLLMAKPVTGRTHQIRVHSQSLGLPLIGDNFYGGSPSDSLHLLAYQLTFPDPITNQKTSVRVPTELLPQWVRGYNY